jgi:hypothetical protein
MNDTLQAKLQNFISTYQGPKVSVLATGGGLGIGAIGMIPGASRLLQSFYSPYSSEESTSFVERYGDQKCVDDFTTKAVSKEAAEALFRALVWKDVIFSKGGTLIHLALTASLTTSRYRRGNNEAFFRFQKPDCLAQTWRLEFPKIPQMQYEGLTPMQISAIRSQEEALITRVVLAKVFDFEASELESELKAKNATLTTV